MGDVCLHDDSTTHLKSFQVAQVFFITYLFTPEVHPVPDRCETVRRIKRIRVAKVVKTNSPASGATAATTTTAADAHRLVANQGRKTKRPRQEATHL